MSPRTALLIGSAALLLAACNTTDARAPAPSSSAQASDHRGCVLNDAGGYATYDDWRCAKTRRESDRD